MCVDKELAVEPRIAGGWIAGEGNARRARVAAVAEDHRLDIHGGAPAFRETVQLPVFDGACVVPTVEHRADCAPKLLVNVLRKRPPEFALHDVLVLDDKGLPVFGREVGIEIVAVLVLIVLQKFLEVVIFHIEHDARVHLDEAAIAVIGEALVA